MLCTQTRTYALRSITVSNSLLVLQPPAAASSSHASPESDLDLTATSGSNRTTFSPALSTKRRRTRSTSSSTPPRTLQLAATSHEILEAQPCPPRLERIGMLLRPSAWAGMEVDRWEGRAGDDDVPRGLGRRWTRRKLESVVQASDEELSRGLRERRVIEWDGEYSALWLASLKSQLTGPPQMTSCFSPPCTSSRSSRSCSTCSRCTPTRPSHSRPPLLPPPPPRTRPYAPDAPPRPSSRALLHRTASRRSLSAGSSRFLAKWTARTGGRATCAR